MSPPTIARFAALLGALALVVLGYGQFGPTSRTAANTNRMLVESSAMSERAAEPDVRLADAADEPEPFPGQDESADEDGELAPWVFVEEPVNEVPLPEQLLDRRLESRDVLLAPDDDVFVSSVTTPPPEQVLARSTWEPDCPVATADLSYLQVSFFGFDGEFHTGELLVATTYVNDIAKIFERLHELRFPIEQMVVVSREDFGDPSNAYTNNTSAFECRQSVTSGRWSRHAFGDAIDINPFHNPYVSGELVIPALAGAYAERDREVPGLITTEITNMFADIGWGWGGDWNSVKDWMHFSATGT